MKKYLLPNEGTFYKANLHCHSNMSDGHWTPEQIKEEYKKHGYSIVAYTDHDLFISRNHLTDSTFLALNGFEIEINDDNPIWQKVVCNHMCMIAKRDDIEIMPCYHRSKYLFGNAPKYRHLIKYDESKKDFERNHSIECINEVIKECKEGGFFVTYNHPNWSLEDLNLYTKLEGLDAMEIYNTSASLIGFLDINEKDYEHMVKSGKYISCVGADDNHNFADRDEKPGFFDSFKSWTCIKAKELSYEAVIEAMENKHLYASQGPEIYELYVEDGFVHIKCSNATYIRYNTGNRVAHVKYALNEGKEFINEASFKIGENDVYFRLTVVDKNNKMANTIAYKVEDYIK